MSGSYLAQASGYLRVVCLGGWFAVVTVGIAAYLIYPQLFTAENVADVIKRFEGGLWLVFFLMSSFRGVTLIPSTPLVLAGTLLFAEHPFAVLAISVLGIFVSSSLIYFFSDYLGFSSYFEKHRVKTVNRVRTRLERRSGSVFIALWAFFPLVPTDLVCYLAGTARMRYRSFITSVLVGETTVCTLYIFSASLLIDRMH